MTSTNATHPLTPAALSALRSASPPTRDRLKKLIERQDPYFVLTGSDPREAGGCCPSSDVGAANVLVEAGVLQSYVQPAPPGGCRVAFYALTGEIAVQGEVPSFSVNAALRQSVLAELLHPPRGARWLLALRWVLLAFVILTLVLIFTRLPRTAGPASSGTPSTNATVAQTLQLPAGDYVLVAFFHRAERCAFCNNMEAYTADALGRYFAGELAHEQVVYREINMDDPQNQPLVQRYGLFTSSVVLIGVRNKAEVCNKVLADAWRLTDSREKFVAMLRDELTRFQERGSR
ncbi:MAG TPA: nitrophenyl compound nitroreductase subunit ArsF family protein [Planctomycetota bacterium]|jgi:hypothetical protein